MFNKTFNEMMAVDISQYTKKRDGGDYLPWGACKKLLHDNGAERVYFAPVLTAEGSSLRMCQAQFTGKSGNTNRCYEVLVSITIDDLTWEQSYPVLNGNNPVQDNSMSQLRVNNAIARAFVKGVAIRTGLGFSLWIDEEQSGDDLSIHNISKIKRRVGETLTTLTQRGMSEEDILSGLRLKRKDLEVYLGMYDRLNKFEEALNAL